MLVDNFFLCAKEGSSAAHFHENCKLFEQTLNTCECATWNLLDRLLHIDCENSKSCVGDFCTAALTSNRGVLVLASVSNWLESFFFEKVVFTTDKVDWLHTLDFLNKKDTQNGCSVSSYDIDSPVRSAGHALAPEDEVREHRFLFELFQLLKSGQIRFAQDLCFKVGQPWRAAILDVCTFENVGSLKVLGDVDRWTKLSLCHFLAHESSLPKFERALYGTMCGDLEAMLTGCSSWQDWLWAHIKAFFSFKSHNFLSGLQNVKDSFEFPSYSISSPFTQGTFDNDEIALVKHILNVIRTNSNPSVIMESQKLFPSLQLQLIDFFSSDEADENQSALLQLMEHLDSISRGGDVDAMRVSVHIILLLDEHKLKHRQTPELFQQIRDSILLRYCHYLQKNICKIDTADAVATQMVVFYASKLSSKYKVEELSKWMENVEDSTSKKQQDVLDAALSFGFDIDDLTQRVVSNIETSSSMNEANLPFFSSSASLLQSGSGVGNAEFLGFNNNNRRYILTGIASRNDIKRVNALKWLTFREGQRLDAVMQSNLLLREFVRSGKLSVALSIFEIMPADTVLVCKRLIEEKASQQLNCKSVLEKLHFKEFVCWGHYLTAVRDAEAWCTQWKSNPSGAVVETCKAESQFSNRRLSRSIFLVQHEREHQKLIEEWTDKEKLLRAETLKSLWAVLLFPSGWLRDEAGLLSELHTMDANAQNIREKELSELRTHCVPQIVHFMIDLITKAKEYSHTWNLINIIADERRQLYTSFPKEELQCVLVSISKLSVHWQQQQQQQQQQHEI